MPSAVCRDEEVGLCRPPTARLVGSGTVVGPEDGLDHGPGGLNDLFAGEDGGVAGHWFQERVGEAEINQTALTQSSSSSGGATVAECVMLAKNLLWS
jgi:hypothetical protein